MTNETDNEGFAKFARFERITDSAFDESKTIFSIICHRDKPYTYRINDAITLSQAKAVIESLSYGEVALSDSATIEEAETIIDILVKQRHPNATEEV